MIISASRRTDIPTYYSDWLFNRIKEEYVLVRNPMNIHQISRIIVHIVCSTIFVASKTELIIILHYNILEEGNNAQL